MAHLMRTLDPAVDPDRDYRVPCEGQVVIYHQQGDGKKKSIPAIVMKIEGEDNVELVTLAPVEDSVMGYTGQGVPAVSRVTRLPGHRNVPRRTEQNPHGSWSFQERAMSAEPHEGQIVIFHIHPDQISNVGKPRAPAIVSAIKDDGRLDLVVIFAGNSLVTHQDVPRRTEENQGGWSFTEIRDVA
jgi:hypothetical protein